MDLGQINNEEFRQNKDKNVKFWNILIDEGFLMGELIFSSFRGLIIVVL